MSYLDRYQKRKEVLTEYKRDIEKQLQEAIDEFERIQSSTLVENKENNLREVRNTIIDKWYQLEIIQMWRYITNGTLRRIDISWYAIDIEGFNLRKECAKED